MLLSFRAEESFAAETDKAATLLGRSRSQHLRIAVENENRRALEQRLLFLSQKLSGEHLAFNQEIDATMGDGLDAR